MVKYRDLSFLFSSQYITMAILHITYWQLCVCLKKAKTTEKAQMFEIQAFKKL